MQKHVVRDEISDIDGESGRLASGDQAVRD